MSPVEGRGAYFSVNMDRSSLEEFAETIFINISSVDTDMNLLVKNHRAKVPYCYKNDTLMVL